MAKYKLLIILILISILSFNFTIVEAKQNKTPSQEFNNEGYVGTLPDLSRQYGSDSEVTTKVKKPEPIPSKKFNSENEIKPIPIDNPTFVNIMLNPDKTSQYVNDIYEIIPLLEEICDLIDEDSNTQIFNAKVYYFSKNAEYIRDKYLNRPEHQFLTYKKLMEVNTHAKSISLLREEANKYNPYLAYETAGEIYKPSNIDQQLEYLKTEINDTITLIKETK